jgi:hypothetical protein
MSEMATRVGFVLVLESSNAECWSNGVMEYGR